MSRTSAPIKLALRVLWLPGTMAAMTTTTMNDPTADDLVVMTDVSWAKFEAILDERGDTSPPRVTYLEGTLELMSPSTNHERLKTYMAAVVEEYLDELGIEYDGIGSWLLKQKSKQAALEPDECYLIGDLTKSRPDLALEVVWTSGGIKKLDVYRRLEVGEVWFWRNGSTTVHILTENGYEPRAESVCLPGFDFALLAEMLALPSLSAVRKQIRARLAARR
jgi:Uma2 family endonuclease